MVYAVADALQGMMYVADVADVLRPAFHYSSIRHIPASERE